MCTLLFVPETPKKSFLNLISISIFLPAETPFVYCILCVVCDDWWVENVCRSLLLPPR